MYCICMGHTISLERMLTGFTSQSSSDLINSHSDFASTSFRYYEYDYHCTRTYTYRGYYELSIN